MASGLLVIFPIQGRMVLCHIGCTVYEKRIAGADDAHPKWDIASPLNYHGRILRENIAKTGT